MVEETLNEENETELEPTPYQNDYRRNLEEPTFNEEEEAETVDVMGQVLEQAETEETAPEGESPEDRRDRYTRMFWYKGDNREALTNKQIKRLMALDPEEAEVALQEIRRGGG